MKFSVRVLNLDVADITEIGDFGEFWIFRVELTSEEEEDTIENILLLGFKNYFSVFKGTFIRKIGTKG